MRKTLKRIIFRKTKFFALRALLNINLLAVDYLTLIKLFRLLLFGLLLFSFSDKKNNLPLHLYLHSLLLQNTKILYTNITSIQQKNNSFFIKRYFSSIHNDTNLIESKNIEICKQIFLDESNILNFIREIEVYENELKYSYLVQIGLTLFGKKQRFLQAIFAVLNEGENKPISECGIHTQLYYNYINNVLAKNINNYLNEIFAKYKYLLVLPEKTDINNINILSDEIKFVFVPSKNLRLLEKKDSILKADIILPIGLDSRVRLRFDVKDSNSFSFIYSKRNGLFSFYFNNEGYITIVLKERIKERISSETPWFLNNQQLASLNFDDSISEEVFKVFTTYMEIFVNELRCLLWTLRPYKCFKNKDDGYNYCLYYFKLAKFLKDNKFISIEEFEKSFDFQIQFILDYLYLEKLSSSLATNFCKHLVEEIDLLIKKQGLYVLFYATNGDKCQISSKKIFDRIELLLIEKFNYKQFINSKLYSKNNFRLYKLVLILVCIRCIVCQHLKIFLQRLFPRNYSSMERLSYFDLNDIEKVRTDLNNDLIPKIFLHEENLKLLFLDSDLMYLFVFEDLESFFQEIINNFSNLKKTNLTFYHYKRLTGQIRLYLELYQEIIDKVKQKNDFVDDPNNFKFNDTIDDPLQISLNENILLYKDFLRMTKYYSLLETLEEKEKSFLEIQKFVHSLPETNIIVSLFQIYELYI